MYLRVSCRSGRGVKGYDKSGRANALPLAYFFESNFTYKGAVCPNTERWHLSWWQENVNGPLEEFYMAERR